MHLNEVLAEVPAATLVQGDANREVSGITHDSRRVSPGDLFVAIPGANHDARGFVAQALERGAAAVVTEGPVELDGDAAVVRVPSARAALADLAVAVYRHPGDHMKMVGVTGTDGKTTTSHLIHAALEQAGMRTGRLTTVGMTTGGGNPPVYYGFTTPEAGELQRMLAQMVSDGCQAAVTEVSSHALQLDRVRGVPFSAAVFTNLTPEHLDFHGTMENYAKAKAHLFAMAAMRGPDSFGVVNADDPWWKLIASGGPDTLYTYGLETKGLDLWAENLRVDGDRSRFTMFTPWGRREMISAMPGKMNVMNWLAATATTVGLGGELDAVVAAAEYATVEGRMQTVAAGQPFEVFVDFAHTPHALETVLQTLRAQTKGRLMVLFGHAGGRDSGNRRPMGRITATLADVVMVTSDNPAHEDPAAISAEIVAGTREAEAGTSDVRVVIDRADALRELLADARPGDTVLLAGKGHEEYQALATGNIDWNDAREARRALADLGWS
ncbi:MULTISPECIES: UDP-N-acetylmuramoyl-L-alanyl-D-glutamate--2,6-diaminopimelate ligase [Catenuloplanes]|uniref:UDP-N-acetylmuramoyl-L-alanyl-D-glutamate--L-lysine ligase n=1 Tax=Catenuloplanes niger TaxID=587534 RepID=A0AAE3ZLJ4_9ACTN|nr:UDP-N-acetylmuramoyl-L-alanyl-D-glutamate--2,6-diaminopimelate ligase [Catenuloplanes niger]MDR7320874.1 UDP-N-acetylmuramoyl-L-alanyl-D-glutamate--2,6-diaminopimelate ligase [Catenuloplanes niger]